MSEVADHIEAHRAQLSPAERRVAEVVLRDPECVAFGTVARVAERAGTSGASVVRLSTRLGYPGYSGLQAAVQRAIGQQLRPAVERIRSMGPVSPARAAVGAGDPARAAVGAGDQARAAVGAGDQARAAVGAGDPARAAMGAGDPARAAVGAGDPARAGAVARSGLDVLSRTLRAELDNVDRTLSAVTAEAFERAVALLADRRRPIRIVAGDAEAGVGAMLAAGLALVREDVVQVGGSDVAVARQLAGVGQETVVVAIDLRRYERWVVEHVTRAVEAGATLVAVTDGPLSPLAALASVSFAVAAEGAGPFDSHVGTLALANALVTGVAGRLRRSATRRLDAVEGAWREAGALVEP